ncbi:hypothetical protein SCLCIDRAFT_498646 [Scleroderma citrinum Foug A]|uniref:Inositol-1-monophosphatase n=1 Tax=Scleroderma citrinum Foug A TaxID=1036808 RepID=A0A0C3EPC3_9AGAM|nr:hypothetical protein SCLCIDRAFT_498646 [Scleroderma citrinum Foug A]
MTTSLGKTELRSILTFTVNLARMAGSLILEGSQAIQSALDIDSKMNSIDLVTEYDVAAENLVRNEIKKAYPDFKFIGEESYSSETHQELTDEPTFCVDPIDGTTNFIHGFPYVCISLGLIYQKRPVLGVIYNPFLDHLYTGIEGQGSYLTRGNGQPMRLPLASPQPLPSLSNALIAAEWGSERDVQRITSRTNSLLRLAGDPTDGVSGGRMAHSIRSLGSVALNLGGIAQGAFDLSWDIGCWPWDVCAGIVIVQEAGGVVTGSHAVLQNADASVDPFKMTPEILTGRKYLIIRKLPDTPQETGREAQLRIAREFYETAEDHQPK